LCSNTRTRAALDRFDRRARYELQQIARLEPRILHAQVTGDVATHLAQRLAEVGTQQTGLERSIRYSKGSNMRAAGPPPCPPPPMRVAGLALRSRAEHGGHVVEPFHIRLPGEMEVATIGL
jgi:hypothetical protein